MELQVRTGPLRFPRCGAVRESAAQQQTNKAERSAWPSGTKISVRIADEVNSSHNHPGDLITDLLNRPYIPELTLEGSTIAGAELR